MAFQHASISSLCQQAKWCELTNQCQQSQQQDQLQHLYDTWQQREQHKQQRLREHSWSYGQPDGWGN